MKPITEKTKNSILRSIKQMVKFNDMSKMTKETYNFLYLASGFIAHYNLYGFIDYYNSQGGVFALVKDILDNKRNNQWDNFRKGEANYDYYMSKKEVYNAICEVIS